MREILFRGLTTDGKWVEGGFTLDAIGQPRITCVDSSGQGLIFHKVIPSTVGEYTNLKDKNGKKIFEGDVMDYGHGRTFSVKYVGHQFVAYFDNGTINSMIPINLYEIIGSIHTPNRG